LALLKGGDNNKDYEYQYKSIMQLLGGTPELRSKKELIDQFIQENLNNLGSSEEVMDEFDSFWEKEKIKAVNEICQKESLISDHFKALVDKMIYSNEDPLREDIVATMETAQSVLQRKIVIPRLTEKAKTFVSIFYDGL
jgi:type I restriction enzyme R subunit